METNIQQAFEEMKVCAHLDLGQIPLQHESRRRQQLNALCGVFHLFSHVRKSCKERAKLLQVLSFSIRVEVQIVYLASSGNVIQKSKHSEKQPWQKLFVRLNLGDFVAD